MFRTAAMVTAFLICLGIFHIPCQLNHKLLGHPLYSTRVITLWDFAIIHILFFQMCQADSRLFWKWLVTPTFPQGEEASSPLGGKWSGKEAAKTCKCLERQTPQSVMVSLSSIHNWNSSWFSTSSTFTLLKCSSKIINTSSKVISVPELHTSSPG